MKYQMWAMVLSLLTWLVLVACDNRTEEQRHLQRVERMVSQFVFVKDKDTGLCFAVFYTTDNKAAVTTVPCEKVNLNDN